MSKILIAYYSRTGRVRRIAETIAAACGADLDPIRDLQSRTTLGGIARTLREATLERPAVIAPAQRDPSTYDVVVMGSPVWVAKMSSPLRAYIQQQRDRFPQVAFFCAMGGVGGLSAIRKMAALSGRDPLASFVILDRRMHTTELDDKIAAFVAQLEAYTSTLKQSELA